MEFKDKLKKGAELIKPAQAKKEWADLERFQKGLNKPPKDSELQVNPFANGSKYLPVSFIEMALDEMYAGIWETTDFKSQIVVNEVIGSIQLRVFHPVAKQWITRTGAGAVPIQMKSGSGVREIDQKINNTLVKDYPHLLSTCLKNAAKSLGKMMGRDVNRAFEDVYTPFILNEYTEKADTDQKNQIERLLHNSTLNDETKSLHENDLETVTKADANSLISFLRENQLQSLEKNLDTQLKLDNDGGN